MLLVSSHMKFYETGMRACPFSWQEQVNLLLVATTLWLRDINGPCGYERFLRTFVPGHNDLYFGNHIPEVTDNYLPVNDGTVYPVINHGRRILWTRSEYTVLQMWAIEHTSREARIHFNWLEWALGRAIVNLHCAGQLDLTYRKLRTMAPVPTIGGLEVATFDDL